MSYMTLEKVQERIVQWFQSERGVTDEIEETTMFVAD